MKLISWNVNGLRACATKGFESSVEALDADVICLQETKMQPGQLELALPGYHQYFLGAVKKGYSGTAVLTRAEPISVCQGIGLEAHDQEGRVLTCEYPDFTLVNCYTPNAQNQLKRLAYRLEWEDAFRAYLMRLDARKPVILCGDLNVAHQEIDLKNPKINHQNAGFSDAEREKLTQLLDSGFIDSFRYFYPDLTGAYSWWSYLRNARATNAGWRIDYFLVSKKLAPRMVGAAIHPEIEGSDHCPVELTLD
ncbi:MAG: exodeoxyribonuclease III [Clostridia bacterium]